jgi:hypothetical protein
MEAEKSDNGSTSEQNSISDGKVFKDYNGESDALSLSGEWYNNLPEAMQQSVIRGLKDAEEGNVIPHEEMKKSYNKWMKKLS